MIIINEGMDDSLDLKIYAHNAKRKPMALSNLISGGKSSDVEDIIHMHGDFDGRKMAKALSDNNRIHDKWTVDSQSSNKIVLKSDHLNTNYIVIKKK